MSTLKEKIEPYLESEFDDLPEEIKSRIKEVDRHGLWGELTLWQRQVLVSQHDFEFDPSLEDERIHFDGLAQQLLEIEDGIETWEASNCQNDPLRMKIKEDKLAELHARRNKLEHLFKQLHESSDITSIKRESIYDQQKELICSLVREAGHDPLRLPDYRSNLGKAGIKSEIRSKATDTRLISSKTNFDKIWGRMIQDGALKYSNEA